MSRRRKQLLAAVGGALVLAVALAAVLASGGGGGSSHSISVPAAQTPAGTSDLHAQDRTQIAALALAYQKALAQDTPADPCGYLDPQSRTWVIYHGKHAYATPESCAQAAREADVSGPGDLSPPGIDPSTIQFGSPSQQVDCSGTGGPGRALPPSQHGMPWAAAPWAGGAGAQVTFVYEQHRWWIDTLLCPG